MKRRQTPFSVETRTPAFAIYILRIMVPTYYLNISSSFFRKGFISETCMSERTFKTKHDYTVIKS